MIYNKPKLIDLNSFPVTAFGQCAGGSGANQRGCSSGGDAGAAHPFDCGSGNSAAAYWNSVLGTTGCAAGTAPAPRSYCSTGATVVTLGSCGFGTGFDAGICNIGTGYAL